MKGVGIISESKKVLLIFTYEKLGGLTDQVARRSEEVNLLGSSPMEVRRDLACETRWRTPRQPDSSIITVNVISSHVIGLGHLIVIRLGLGKLHLVSSLYKQRQDHTPCNFNSIQSTAGNSPNRT